MKKIIHGRRYDTQTAICLGVYKSQSQVITTYQKQNGEMFLHIVDQSGERIKPIKDNDK